MFSFLVSFFVSCLPFLLLFYCFFFLFLGYFFCFLFTFFVSCVFLIISFVDTVFQLLFILLPFFFCRCQHEFSRPKPPENLMADVYDSPAWKQFMGPPVFPNNRIGKCHRQPWHARHHRESCKPRHRQRPC